MTDSWITPGELLAGLSKEFPFDCDPCPLEPVEDGLTKDWGKMTFVNPPYSKVRPWIEKAIEEAKKGNTVAMLLKSDTSTTWFHDLILPNAEIRWIRGRVQFTRADGSHSRNSFPSMLCIFSNERKKK